MSETENERFRKDYLATVAFNSILSTYGYKNTKNGKKIYELSCDMFQAAARHTGLIKHFPRYWSANTGKWEAHIPSLMKMTHGIVRWRWEEDECPMCPNEGLCWGGEKKEEDDEE
jgi:hypothetical protein